MQRVLSGLRWIFRAARLHICATAMHYSGDRLGPLTALKDALLYPLSLPMTMEPENTAALFIFVQLVARTRRAPAQKCTFECRRKAARVLPQFASSC